MSQYYVNFDASGNVSGFYLDELHGDTIPETAKPITEAEWQRFTHEAWKWKFDGERIREKTQAELDEENANLPPIKKSPEQRITELEGESVQTMLAVAEAYETAVADNAQREQEAVDTMLGLTEVYDLFLQQQETIQTLRAEVDALKGGVS
ncbi:hypothetical protein [Cohnella nanjingensis]|uniref:Bacteriophage SP-beta YorD domain-containing protein n=1 Tax=Cohnella nanjingensis TaxID=1387779 RepID=A0A7X0VHV2_9BACL|nr:hypothetical protein [Cohnella nanjingensis]MBB6673029.1 hypothetical protein [Cohnella nanjingensis]